MTADQLPSLAIAASSSNLADIDLSRNRLVSVDVLPRGFHSVRLLDNAVVCSCQSSALAWLIGADRFVDYEQTACSVATISSSGQTSSTWYLLACYWDNVIDCPTSSTFAASDPTIYDAPIDVSMTSLRAVTYDELLQQRCPLQFYGVASWFQEFDAAPASLTSALVRWTINYLTGVVGYRLTVTHHHNATDVDVTPVPQTMRVNVDANRTSYDIGNLTSGSRYSVCSEVVWHNTENNESLVDVTCRDVSLPEELSTAANLTMSAVVVSTTSVRVTWTVAADMTAFVDNFRLSFAEVDSTSKRNVLTNKTVTQYTVTDLTSGRQYVVCVEPSMHDGSNVTSCSTVKMAPSTGFPLLLVVIIAAAAAFVLLVIVIIIVIVCRKRRNAKKNEAAAAATSDDVNVDAEHANPTTGEKLGEQMVVCVDIYETISK